MRILTVRQPWAWAIIHGGKDVENRVRNVAGAYRGTVAIHAAIGKTADLDERHERLVLSADETGKIDAWLGGESIEGGVIIGVVDLVDVHRAEGSEAGIIADMIRDRDPYALNGSCSRWADANMHHLVLKNPRPLAEPIPFKGALGLRTLDDDTTARVLAQIATGATHD